MDLNNIREGELKEIFDVLEEAFKANDIDFYLIGAIARDVWYARGNEEFRATKDVDFAVFISNKEDYHRVRQYLENIQGYNSNNTNAFLVTAPDGVKIDLLPFGELEIDNDVYIEGRGLTTIKVNGFREVYDSGTEDITLQTGHHFKIATLPALVLLKFIAYDDRPEMRYKDARDIINIIYHYFNLQSDLIYSDHTDLFEGESLLLPLEVISAIVIAREIKKIISINQSLIERLTQILSNHISQVERSAFIRNMANESGKAVEDVVKILQAMLDTMM